MIFKNSDRTKFQHFLIFQGGEKIERELGSLGVKVFVSHSLKKKISIKTFIEILSFIRDNEIEIIHTHMIKAYSISGLVNLFLKKKSIFNYHGLFLNGNPYNNLLEKIIYRFIHNTINLFGKTDVVLVPSKRSKELLLKETTLFPEPVVYYNGCAVNQSSFDIDPEMLKSILKIKGGKLIIAFIGRLEIQKRADKAIELFRDLILKKKNICLLIFGEGKLEANLQKLVNKYGLSKDIKFMGYVEGIENFYYLFDIVLFTSDWEGMPLTMWEAMANKVPVVAPDVGGFKEIIEDNNCGRIYHPADLKDAEEKVLELLNNENSRKISGENGIKAIEKKYNQKSFINQIEQIYLNLAGR